MSKVIEVPGVGNVEFPDTMSDEQIATVLRGQTQSTSNIARERHAQMATSDNIDPKTGGPVYKGGVASEFFTNTPTGNFLTGVGKGAAETAYNLGEGVRSITPGVGHETGPNDITDALEAKNTMQSVGKGAVRIGEFFVAPQATAGKLAPLAARLGAMGNTARTVGPAAAAATKGAGTFGKMLMEGANSGAVTAAQGGNPITGAVAGFLGAGASAVAGKAAPKVVNYMLDAPAKSFTRGANPGRGITNEGIAARGLVTLSQKVGDRLNAVGDEIGKTLLRSDAANTARVNVEAVYKPILDEARQALTVAGKNGAVSAIDSLEQGLNSGFTSLGSAATGATPREAWIVNDLLKRSIRYGGTEGVETAQNAVIQKVRSAIAQKVAEAIPEIRPLNARYADLAEASSALNARMSKSFGLGDAFRHSALGGGAYLATHFFGPAAGIGTFAAGEALHTAPGATLAAQGLRGLGSAAGRATMARTAGAAASGLTSGPTEEPNPRDKYLRAKMRGK